MLKPRIAFGLLNQRSHVRFVPGALALPGEIPGAEPKYGRVAERTDEARQGTSRKGSTPRSTPNRPARLAGRALCAAGIIIVGAATHATAAPPPVQPQSDLASWYAPTREFGCPPYTRPAGPRVIGVATNDPKRLPCGALLTITWHGREHRVRVVDTCGPGCDANHVLLDFTVRLARKMPGFVDAGVASVEWRAGW